MESDPVPSTPSLPQPDHTGSGLKKAMDYEVASLFRKEALQARATGTLPTVIRVQAPYLGLSSVFAGIIIVSLVLLLSFGRLTQIVSVPGVLLPEKSSLKIFTPQSGVLLEVDAAQGQHVKKGQTLFKISAERFSGNGVPLMGRASELIRTSISAIRHDEGLAREISQERTNFLMSEIELQSDHLAMLGRMVGDANDAVELDKTVIMHKGAGQNSDGDSLADLKKSKDILFADQQRLLSLMNDSDLAREKIRQYNNELERAPLQLAATLAESEQKVSAAEVELARNESMREFTVGAPMDGVVVTSIAFAGQTVTTETPLMVVDPEGSKLQAQVLVPSSGVGFLTVGSKVLIKYDAYPYQIFGYYGGHISSIGKIALLSSELQLLKTPVNSKVPVFNVLVDLDRQEVNAYDGSVSLLAGSTLTANLTGETRYLWQWVLNPVLSVKGDAFSRLGGQT